MGFGWRRKRSSGAMKMEGNNSYKMDKQLTIPNHFVCPISLDLMNDPVTLSSGITYDRENIEKWLDAGKFTCPVTNQVLRSFDLIPNHSLRQMIQEWCVENRSYGVERIPTPRVPVSPLEVSEALLSIVASGKRVDQYGCLDSLRRIKKWSDESERNRRCMHANGAITFLAVAFDEFAGDDPARNANVLEEILVILSAMARAFSLVGDQEAQKRLGSRNSLQCMVWFLNRGELSAKENSIAVLKELLSSNQQCAETLSNIEGVKEVLFSLIKNQVSLTITKSSLQVTFHLVSLASSENPNPRSEFIKMGLVSLLQELIIDSEKDKSTTEKALGVLNQLCDCGEGREEAYKNALTIPILVKKILRVSPLASEYSVSAIWKLSKYGREHEETVVVEALQVGAFQKLVLLLQLGCGDETKEKATELLKLMNPYRSTQLECIDSIDFKNLKRSF